MNTINEQIRQIINTPISEIDVEKGALILLKINRNQILYKNIVRRKDVERLLYNLKKVLELRGGEIAEPIEEEKDTTNIDEKNIDEKRADILPESKGKREDHDQLPEEIKAAWLENFNIYPQMRKLHEQLKLMNDKPEEERKNVLDELMNLDKKHRENWNIYDNYQPGVDVPNQPTEADPKSISSARKFLSTNKTKVATLEGENKKNLMAKMQQRLDYLIEVKAGISDEQMDEYRKLGLNA